MNPNPSQMPDSPKITSDMIILDVVAKYPETMEVFFEYGIHCVGCTMSQYETLEQGAALHGIDLDELLEDLNDFAGEPVEV